MSVDATGSEKAEDKSSIKSVTETEPETDGIPCKPVNQVFKSNLVFFKSLENSDGSTKSRRRESWGEGTTAENGLTPGTTSTTPSVDTERSYSPGSKSSSMPRRPIEKTIARTYSVRHIDTFSSRKEESIRRASSLHDINSSSTSENEMDFVSRASSLRDIDSSCTWEKELKSERRLFTTKKHLRMSRRRKEPQKERLSLAFDSSRQDNVSGKRKRRQEPKRRSSSSFDFSLLDCEQKETKSSVRFDSPKHDDVSSNGKEEPASRKRFDSPKQDDVSSNEKDKLESRRSSLLCLQREFSPDDMQVFQQPMCLVRTEDNRMIIEDKTVEQINKIPWPLIIVAIVGLYRTGKSYLMNLLAGPNRVEGFALGNTIQSKTKGIWVWCKVHPTKPNNVLMLLDTEGLGDVEKGDPNHDNKIFTLATLLCNCLVYNMKGVFDQDAVGKLTFITEMSKFIHFRGSQENECLNLVLPDLVLCLRDFSLKLVKDGRTITEDEYLEECLEVEKGRDDRFNKPRECIRKYFPVRKCLTFPVPGDGDVIENLETLPFGALSKKFKEAICHFDSYISNLTPKGLLASKPITGQMFKTLAMHYVTNLNQDAILDVDGAFRATAYAENNRIRRQALVLFTKRLIDVKLPAPSRIIEDIYTKAQRETLKYLRENVVHDTDEHTEIKTQKAMDDFMRQLEGKNTRKIRDMCEVTLQNESTKLRENINKNHYRAAGGHKIFKRDLNKLKDKFMNDLRDFEEHEIVWTWYCFEKTLESTESEIIEADEYLSQQEKEAERRHYLEQITRINESHEKGILNALEEQRKLMEAHYEKMRKDREEQFRKEAERFKALSKLKLERDKAMRELQELKIQQQKKKKKWFFFQ